MNPKKIRTITINIFEDGSSDVQVEEHKENKCIKKDDINRENIVIENTRSSPSWLNYGLITYSRNSDLFKELVNIEGDKITVSMYGSEFVGKIDKKQARIYSLQGLMKFIKQQNYNILDVKAVKLLYRKDNNVLEIHLVQ
ncbi:hypothetical protein [Tepidibacter formicigenes]|jgi:hypothetical protein|uniref:Uncharacterized protein n=1 Tax=Tepidibacter formicigenes DSM 15518 TaxID=1123349 RepID=A0A1M6RJG1_9FIRM|nr:hypothetical protein [Tepidibacter formicigenes]SHK32582.1 hypothetical protein SAMN02744037_02123 [Tepidibacter formicigenes DSM 15518]